MAELHDADPSLKMDFMTLPDVVFPTFLFIVGLSLPFALERRIARGESMAKLAGHIVLRSAELVLIGVCMVNIGAAKPIGGISADLWRLLLFPSMILLWNRYPEAGGFLRWLFIALRVLGVGVLVYLLVIFRKESDGALIWMTPKWWGILGIIGWAYLVSALLWLACRDLGAAVMGAMGLLIAIRLGAEMGYFDWWQTISQGYLPGLGGIAGHASAVVAGMAVATLFRPNSPIKTPWGRIAWILVFAAGFALAGLLVRPLLGLGIWKNRCTPAWIFDCSAIACAIYAILYWLIDVMKIDRWTFLIAPAGSNTLLMYLLPWIVVYVLAMFGIDYSQYLNDGWWGVLRAAMMAVCLVTLTGLLTRCGIRLHL